MTVARHPTRESVLACVTDEYQTTHRIFRAWLGRDDHDLPRSVRNELRQEIFWLLDGLYLMRLVEKRQVSETRAEWRRRRPADPEGPRDVYTNTERDAAAFERMVH